MPKGKNPRKLGDILRDREAYLANKAACKVLGLPVLMRDPLADAEHIEKGKRKRRSNAEIARDKRNSTK